MDNHQLENLTHSEFYRKIRPEYFSDSEIAYKVELPKEFLAYELEKITTNQKEAQFETLCRRLAEKQIAPNLIPQVGPTGGGDGKTDFETYPVSSTISKRWFRPENGWSKEEKWAFAISAKKTWKSKLKSDIESILSTEREYTRIYFMTNQTPSSKKKKDAQDEYIKKYNIDIVILDGAWILETVYGNNLIEIVVNALNLSGIYKEKTVIRGANDTIRLKELEELDANIDNPNRYHEYDFQLFEDALSSAILARKVEKPKAEVIGRFDRAIRICEKIDNKQHWTRLHYQRAWTFLQYYDDYNNFFSAYKAFKKYISEDYNIDEAELYNNLVTLIQGLKYNDSCDLKQYNIDADKEIEALFDFLATFEGNEQKPCSAVIAKLFRTKHEMFNTFDGENNVDNYINKITTYIEESKNYADFPFEMFKDIFERFGKLFPNSEAYDNLIDTIAAITEKRTSELSAARMFLKRAIQKTDAGYYKESTIYFGKAVLKFAKDESQNELYLAMIGLSEAYSSLGLLWASNSCLTAAAAITLRSFYRQGVLNIRAYNCVKGLMINELFIGRIPSFLSWYELENVLGRMLEKELGDKKTSDNLVDACLLVRLLHTKDNQKGFTLLPKLLEKQDLWMAQDGVLYKLGYYDLVLPDYKQAKVNSNSDLDRYFNTAANQPFVSQMLYDTNLMSKEMVSLKSKILGCVFDVRFKNDRELVIIAELLLAFFESFLATGLSNVHPIRDKIIINIVGTTSENKAITFEKKETTNKFDLTINLDFFKNSQLIAIEKDLVEFIAHVIFSNFHIEDAQKYMQSVFEKEEVQQRISLILEHQKFTREILGNRPKLLFKDWTDNQELKEYPMKRKDSITFQIDKKKVKIKDSEFSKNNQDFDPNKVPHNNRKVLSIVDNDLWDKADWQGFGSFFQAPSFFGLFMLFRNGKAGEQVFDNWIEQFGTIDKNDEINLTIVTGVNKNQPLWYRVSLTPKLEFDEGKDGGLLFINTPFIDVRAETDDSLKKITSGYKHFKKYRLAPAKILPTGKIELITDKIIKKTNLEFKEAWQIGLQDIHRGVILKDDNPIIPKHIKDAPILKLLSTKQ